MALIDMQSRERRARLKYEFARLRRALWGFAPSLVLVGVAASLNRHPRSALGFGLGLFAVGVALLWYGRAVRRAVLPGLALGFIPLAFALCANHIGHMCTGDDCMMLCVPICAAGGLTAGIGVAIIGHRHRSAPSYWIATSIIALLTGAMGCACVGYSGLIGLALGYAVGFMPVLVRQFVR